MKLITKIFAVLTLVGFASCCNDNENYSNPKDAPDAKIAVQMKVSGQGSSVSGDDPNALPGEENINNLTAVVFDETGEYVLGEPMRVESVNGADGVYTLLNIPAKAVVARLVVIANAPASILSGWTNYSEFKQKLAFLSDQSQSSLLMSTRVITSEKRLVADDNYIGYENATNINGISKPLELTRIPARIEIVSVNADFAGSKNASGATLHINSVKLNNMKTASYSFSEDYWGGVNADNNLVDSLLDIKKIVMIEGVTTLKANQCYVMENLKDDAHTTITVNASIFKYGFYPQNRDFVAVINKDGINKEWKHNYVKRNYIYRLRLNFGPNSFDPLTPTPDPAPPVPTTGDLDCQVEVVGWGPVDQNVEIE